MTTTETVAQFRKAAQRLQVAGVGLKDAERVFEKDFIVAALERNKANQCRAARELQVHRNTLNRKIEDLGLREELFRIRNESFKKSPRGPWAQPRSVLVG